MTDIVERLRKAAAGYPFAKVSWPHRLLHDAAEEIARLRSERSSLRDPRPRTSDEGKE